MSLPFSIDRAGQDSLSQASRDPRALRILAKTIYRELRQSGLVEEDVMSVAGELLSLVAGDVQSRRRPVESLEPANAALAALAPSPLAKPR